MQDATTDSEPPYRCESCGEPFATLTEMRLHRRDTCPERTEQPVPADVDLDELSEDITQELRTCENCGYVLDEDEDMEMDWQTEPTIAVRAKWRCDCGWTNLPEVILS